MEFDDDPEKRIRELEHGLSTRRRSPRHGGTGYSDTVTYHSGSPKVIQSGYEIVVKQG
jgi:hypothetical protein